MQAETLTATVIDPDKASIQTVKNFIGGRWIASESGRTVPNINPANTNEILCYTPLSSREEAQAAVAAARDAFPGWKATPAPARGKLMFKAMNLLQERIEDVAIALTREEGKIIRESRGEVLRSINIMEYNAGEGRRLKGSTIPSELLNTFIYTIRQPVGVCGLITPWNFPVAVPIWKLAPALVAGNTVVFKPSTYTPLTSVKIIEIFEEAGFSSGVVNLVHGGGKTVGDELVNNPDVKAISFTGSNAVGNAIYTEASRRGIRVQCEMGGKNPLVVLADADLPLAVEGVIQGGFGSTGQRCTAASRVIVEEPVVDEFRNLLLTRMESLRVGDGMEPQTEIGPSIEENQMKTVLRYIDIGKSEGARLLRGGRRMNDARHANGYFVEPTLFDGVSMNMRIAQEEIFGPVVSLITAKNFDDAVALANGVNYGLSASLYSQDISKIMRFAELAEVGKVHINNPTIGGEAQAPFGGIKATGIGPRECGSEAFEFYTEIKTVYLDYTGRKRETNIY
ncbi:MAG TPA: aldehyde dehydrogenase family protein [Bacteroidota bacterium]|jgi:aldehyde dehydrogenase (NAD+)|nr:aldehyde dehydrogenase family protein [Bacteroidota bacterium]